MGLMTPDVATNATNCQDRVASQVNDAGGHRCSITDMRRKHYIREWAEHRDKRQVDVIEATGADKSNVSRWFSGQMPEKEVFFEPLVKIFEVREWTDLCMHPDEYEMLMGMYRAAERGAKAARPGKRLRRSQQAS